MISPAEPIAGRGRKLIYQLEVSLTGVEPLIWRRLQVPGQAKLGWLHAVLQVAMGWTNSHLHQFICKEHTYSDPTFEMDEYEDDPPVQDENKAILAKLCPKVGDGLAYEYDFGDSWEHVVTVERILFAAPAAPLVAACLDGARACPPEDCGGVWGYEELQKALKNRKHPEHRRLKEWVGGRFDAEAFDAAATTKWLSHLTWPRVTQSRLGKILQARHSGL